MPKKVHFGIDQRIKRAIMASLVYIGITSGHIALVMRGDMVRVYRDWACIGTWSARTAQFVD